MIRTIKAWFGSVLSWLDKVATWSNNTYFILSVWAFLAGMVAFDFSSEPPQEIALSNGVVWGFGALLIGFGFVIYYIRRNFAAGFQTAGSAWNELLWIGGFAFALVSMIAMTPPLIGSGARYFDAAILTCPNPRMVDYTWFVLDNVAKGVLLDFLESFDFDLYDQACAPIRHNTITSVIKLSIRSFSTYILIWFAIKLWGSVRVRVFRVA